MARSVITPKGKWARVYGIPELANNVNSLLDKSNGPELKREVFMPPAVVLRDAAKRNAQWRHVGNALYVAMGDPKKPNVLVGVNFRNAPDAYWLEYGTYLKNARYPKKHKFLKFIIDGRVIFTTSVANLMPHSYMRKAVTEYRSRVVADVADGFERFIQKYGNSFPATQIT